MSNIAIYIFAFTITALFIHFLRPQAIRVGLVDRPNERKQHEGEIPLIGGLAIFLGFICAVLLTPSALGEFRALLLGSVILVAVGLADDYLSMPLRPRFLAQILAALVMSIWGGVMLTDLGYLSFDGGLLLLGVMAIPFTVFATVGVINALNMSDGIDGLSGSLTVVALTGLAIMTYTADAWLTFTCIMLLISAVAAFLMFNVRFSNRLRALVFLGDSGSMFLGFALTWFVISLSQGEQRIISPVTALWFLAMPLFDTVGVMLRRVLKGRSPFQADREHFHHALQLAGYSVIGVNGVIVGLALVCLFVGLAGQYLQISDGLMFSGFLSLFGIYFFGMMHAWKVMKFIRLHLSSPHGSEFSAMARIKSSEAHAKTSTSIESQESQLVYLDDARRAVETKNPAARQMTAQENTHKVLEQVRSSSAGQHDDSELVKQIFEDLPATSADNSQKLVSGK